MFGAFFLIVIAVVAYIITNRQYKIEVLEHRCVWCKKIIEPNESGIIVSRPIHQQDVFAHIECQKKAVARHRVYYYFFAICAIFAIASELFITIPGILKNPSVASILKGIFNIFALLALPNIAGRALRHMSDEIKNNARNPEAASE